MKSLQDLLVGVDVISVTGNAAVEVGLIAFDSREAVDNSVFVAQRGVHVDGHLFIDKAIENGAKAVVCEELSSVVHDEVTYVLVKSSNDALAFLSANFYGNPSREFTLIGVTGTNGKTTIATLLYNLFQKLGYKVGLLSTVKILVNGKHYDATHTTPNSVMINKYMAEMVAEGVEYCFMEVSSHGIHQKRTQSLVFDGGVFTNLTHDHLEYHQSFANYRDVKKSFFDDLPSDAFALVNVDDKNGMVMLQNTKASKKTYALKTMADFKTKILEKQFSGSLLAVNGVEVWSKLIGAFNAYNLTAIYGVACLLGMDKLKVLQCISGLESVTGRFQCIKSKEGVVGIVDFAHTPDALKNVLETINDIKIGNEKVITVVGCGGDRDKTKRPKMAHIASQLSDTAIFTSDNPRTEDPQSIVEDMENGVAVENKKKTLSIVNRSQAIKTACQLAQSNDIVLLAGKGHETYQIVKQGKVYFSDLEEITRCFNQ